MVEIASKSRLDSDITDKMNNLSGNVKTHLKDRLRAFYDRLLK